MSKNLCREDGKRADAGLYHGENDPVEGFQLARAVDPRGLQYLAGDALGKLLDEEHAERPADDRVNNRAERIVELERGHLADERYKDDLLRQGHRADDERENEPASDEALLGQRITGHGGGDAGEDHGHDGHEHGVDHPADGSGSGGAYREVDGLAVSAELGAKGHSQLPQRGALAGEQLL